MTGGFRRGDAVASADGDPRKSRGAVQAVLRISGEQWDSRSYCWTTLLPCMRGSQPCLRSRPDGPGTWAFVVWAGRPGPYAERAGNLVRI